MKADVVQLTMNAMQAKRHRDFVQHASFALVLLVEARSLDGYSQIKSPYFSSDEEKRMFTISSDQLKYQRMIIPRNQTILVQGDNRERANYWMDLLQPVMAGSDIDEARAHQVNLFNSFPPPTYIVALLFVDMCNTTRS